MFRNGVYVRFIMKLDIATVIFIHSSEEEEEDPIRFVGGQSPWLPVKSLI